MGAFVDYMRAGAGNEDHPGGKQPSPEEIRRRRRRQQRRDKQRTIRDGLNRPKQDPLHFDAI